MRFKNPENLFLLSVITRETETCIGYPKRKIPDPTQTRNRVGFGFENQFFSGRVRV